MEGRKLQNFKTLAKSQIRLIKEYKTLVDSYVLDFFTKDHWKQLNPSWWDTLKDLDPPEIAVHLLSTFSHLGNQDVGYKKVPPLSLLAFKAACSSLSLPRQQANLSDVIKCFKGGVEKTSTNNKLSFNFKRHVKEKKQHQIEIIGEIIAKQAKFLGCSHVVDVGAGLGHLSRLLSLSHKLHVVSIEAQSKHSSQAHKYNREALENLGKNSEHIDHTFVPQNITQEVTPTTTSTDFMKIVKKNLEAKNINDNNSTRQTNNGRKNRKSCEQVDPRKAFHPPLAGPTDFSLIGLHPCGDLSTTMLKVFVDSPEIRGLVCVPCCYMQLTQRQPSSQECASPDTGQKWTRKSVCSAGLSTDTYSYPMSKFVKGLDDHLLGFNACELACHFMEEYYCKLQDNDPNILKCHCYRAVLEVIINEKWPDHLRAGVRMNKKKNAIKTFDKYVQLAMKRLCLPYEPSNLDSKYKTELSQWRHVVVYYTLRLLLAPVIESLILCDRLLFLSEEGIPACVVPVFDPKISARNFAIIAGKKPTDDQEGNSVYS